MSRSKVLNANELNKRPFRTSLRSRKDEPFGFAQKLRRTAESTIASAMEGASRLLGTKVPPPRAAVPEKPSPAPDQHLAPESAAETESKQPLTSPQSHHHSVPRETDEQLEAQNSSKSEVSSTPSGRLIQTSHMTGIIQRIAYHLLFRPTGAKSTGKMPIQVATLAPTHAINSLACVVESVIRTYNPDEILHADTAPLRNVCIVVPTEAYKFQAREYLRVNQIEAHRSWVLLTEDEFWSSLFPGYSNEMTPYIDSIGCVVLPHGAAAQKFVETALLSAPSSQNYAQRSKSDHHDRRPSHKSANSQAHFTKIWSEALDENAKANNYKSSQMRPGHHYGRYSVRELIWAISRPENDFDTRMQLPRLQHAVQALKATKMTDVIAFNTSTETLSLLSTLHGLIGEFSGDSTLPDFLASFHDASLSDPSFKRPKRQEWMPNMSFALDFLAYSNVSIPYLALRPSSIDDLLEPQTYDFVEKTLDHNFKQTGPSPKCASYGFWESSRGNTLLSRRASQADTMPSYMPTLKTAFLSNIDKDHITTKVDGLFSVTAHLELSREAISEAVPLLLSVASHALATRDTPSIPLRILCQNNIDIVSISSMLEMQNIPTVSQNLFATPPVRMLCDLFTILIELSKQSVVARAKNLETQAKKDEAHKSTEAAVASDSNSEAASPESPSAEERRPKKKRSDPKSELHWVESETGDVNLAAAFHSLLHEAYGFDNISARHVESRMMYQFIKYQDPIMSLLLGIATDAKYMSLNPQQARKKAHRDNSAGLVAKERANMMKHEVDKSIELATEDAELMISLLQSPDTPFRTKALASEVLRLQQAWAKHELEERQGGDISGLLAGDQHLPHGHSTEASSDPNHQTASSNDLNGDSTISAAKEETLDNTSKKSGSSAASSDEPSPADALYSAKTDRRAIEGAKHLYQDLAYLIGAIRAMPLSPSDIIDLYVARHSRRVAESQLHRHKPKNAQGTEKSESSTDSESGPTKKSGGHKQAILDEEAISLMKAFSAALKGLSHGPASTRSEAESSSPGSQEVLTERYVENAMHMQRALQFVKHAYVEIPAESFSNAMRRARGTSMKNHADRAPFYFPVVLSLDNFADNSGDFAVSLRVFSDPHLSAPQPTLLPPPSFFTAESPKLPTTDASPRPKSSKEDPSTQLKADWDALKLRRLFASTLLYSFTSSRFSYPFGDSYPVPYREAITLKTLTTKLETAMTPPKVRSLAFDSHAVNNPTDAEVESYFELPEGVMPTNPSVGSMHANYGLSGLSTPPEPAAAEKPSKRPTDNKKHKKSPKKTAMKLETSKSSTGNFADHSAPQSASKAVSSQHNAPTDPKNENTSQSSNNSSSTPEKKQRILDYSHPVMDIPRDSLQTPLNMAGPSFVLFGSHRPFGIGSSSIRVFRECQILFALRYVWSAEPGKPASIYATAGMALHEAASKVHTQMLEKLALAMKASAEVPKIEAVEATSPSEVPAEGAADAQTTVELTETPAADPAAPVEITVSPEETMLVQETLIEGAFKTSLMHAQGLTEEEADLLLSKPEYRQHVERAKKQTLLQWEKEKTKSQEMATKLKAKKEKLRAEKLEKRKASAAAKAKAKIEAPAKDDAATVATKTDEEATREAIIAGETLEAVPESVTAESVEKKPDEETVAVGVESLDAAALELAKTESVDGAEVTIEKVVEKVEQEAVVEEIEDELENEADSDDELVEASQYSFSEQEFSFKLPTGHFWRGAWDRIDIDPETGSVEITEYKTSLKRNRESGLFQLHTYALAYWKLHHVLPSKLILASLSTNHAEEYIPTKLDLIRTENLILATLQRMADGLYAPTHKPSQCFSCNYSLQCPSALTASPLYLPAPKYAPKVQEHHNVIDTSKIVDPTSAKPSNGKPAKRRHSSYNFEQTENSDNHDQKTESNEKKNHDKPAWQRNPKSRNPPRFHVNSKSPKEPSL